MNTKLIMTAGSKGGVGKSTVMCLMNTWYRENGIQPLLVDADETSGTLKRFFPEAKCVVPHRRKSYDTIVDLIEAGQHPLILLDLKAGVDWDVLGWFSDIPWEELTELGVSITAVGVLTSSPDSVSSFLRWPDALGRHVNYLIVKNLVHSDAGDQKPKDVTLPAYDLTKQALQFRKLFKPNEMVLPALDPEYMGELERVSLTISDVLARDPRTPPTLSSMIVRSKLRNYLAKVYRGFEANKELLLP